MGLKRPIRAVIILFAATVLLAWGVFMPSLGGEHAPVQGASKAAKPVRRQSKEQAEDDSDVLTLAKMFADEGRFGSYWVTIAEEHKRVPLKTVCGENELIRYGSGDNWTYFRRCRPTKFYCHHDVIGIDDPVPNGPKQCQCLKGTVVDLFTNDELAVIRTATCLTLLGGDGAKIKPQVDAMFAENPVHPAKLRRDRLEKYGTSGRPSEDGACHFREDGFEAVMDQIDIAQPKAKQPRLLCMIYTMAKKAEAHAAIRDTWGAECDGLWLMSTVHDPATMQVNVHHYGPEDYYNMWQKSRSIWAFAHEWNKRAADEEKFDWFIIGGDDLYVIPDNLRAYVGSDEIVTATEHGTKPLYVGRRFKRPHDKRVFNSGGAGYVLNGAALDVLVANIDDRTKCARDVRAFDEDLQVAMCLKQQGIVPHATRDGDDTERFNCFPPDYLYEYRHAAASREDWYPKYTMGTKKDFPEAISKETVSFHYVSPTAMRRAHRLLYQCKHAPHSVVKQYLSVLWKR